MAKSSDATKGASRTNAAPVNSIPEPRTHDQDKARRNRHPANQEQPKSTWSRYRLAYWMMVASALLGLTGYLLVPSQSDASTPPYTTVVITSKVPLEAITFTVYPPRAGKQAIEVQETAKGRPFHSQAVEDAIWLPHGLKFTNCIPSCNKREFYVNASIKNTFVHSTSTAVFEVNSEHLSWSTNSTNITAVLPDVTYNGPGDPLLFVRYSIAHADNYDWNSLPETFATKNQVAWKEVSLNGHSTAEVATGINHQSEQSTATLTFLAGALVGAAAAALVGAMQEGLHELYGS